MSRGAVTRKKNARPAGGGARSLMFPGGKEAGYREASRFAATCSQDTTFQNAVM